jgi:uncharacterized membrane protein YsdA (DUF1294 family)/cold shock CspA family protein
MRYTGTLTSWTDDRGFGWIAADEGGEPVFAHIKAFGARAARPQANQRLSFEIELNPQGKKRATRIEPLRAASARPLRPPQRPQPAAAWGLGSRVALAGFALLYGLVALRWGWPAVWVAALYAGASVACFIAYALDKSAAQRGSWRTAESTLLMLGLVGGWPGAIVAQQTLRHKTSKASFRSAFWGSVLINVAAFVLLHSPLAAAWLTDH